MGERIDADGFVAYLAEAGDVAVIVLHEWWGLVPWIEQVCDRLAGLGLTAVAPDLYEEESVPHHEVSRAQWLQQRMDRHRAIGQVASLTSQLRDRGCRRVGLLGFCTGGALALAAAAGCRVDATVAYYGLFPHSGERTIQTPVLIHVAEHEEHNPPCLPENFPTYFAGMPNVDMHVYPGTMHAFANDELSELYDPLAADLAWRRTTDFLEATLDLASASPLPPRSAVPLWAPVGQGWWRRDDTP